MGRTDQRLTVAYVIVFALGALGGWVVGVLRPRRTPAKPHTTVIALRHAAPRPGDAYRDAASDVSCTLEELRADLVAAGLPAVLDGPVLSVARGTEQIRVEAHDPRRVTLATVDATQTGCETLYYELALALVPRFGPVRLTVAMFGAYLVDGTRDSAALVEERSARISAIAAAIVSDMQDKQRAYGGPA